MEIATTQTRSLWRHSNFLKLWTSETISSFGGQFSGLAIPLTAFYYLRDLCVVKTGPNACSFEFGILAAMGTFPFLFIGLFVGVWVDWHRRRPILVMTNLGRAALFATIPIFFLAGALGLVGYPLLYTVAFLIGILTVFFDVAYQAYLPSLVQRDQLVDANGKLEASRSSAQVTGPSIAGAVIQIISAPIAISLDAISFLGSAFSLSRIDHKESVEQAQERPSVSSDIREGLAVVFGDRRLTSIAGSTGTSNFFSSAMFAIFVLYAVGLLGLTPFTLGLVFSIGSVGALVGVATAAPLARRIGVGPAIVLSIAMSGPGLIGVYLAAQAYSTKLAIGSLAVSGSILVLIIAQLTLSWSTVVYNVNQVSLRQAIVPLRLQGRLNATMRFLVWGTLPLGGLVGGILGATIGIHNTIGVAAVGGSLAFLWVLLSPVRGLERIPEPMS